MWEEVAYTSRALLIDHGLLGLGLGLLDIVDGRHQIFLDIIDHLALNEHIFFGMVIFL
jgi:hypothetical protein